MAKGFKPLLVSRRAGKSARGAFSTRRRAMTFPGCTLISL